MKTAIWWIRRDLRLADNVALVSAMEQAERVLPVFVLDPSLLASPYCGEKRLSFLLSGLHELDSALRLRGSSLVVRKGNPLMVLAELHREVEAGGIFAQEDFSPYARTRDRRVASTLPLKLVPGLTAHHPETLLKTDGTPYTVFTPFMKRWRQHFRPGDPIPAPTRIPSPEGIPSQNIPGDPSMPSQVVFPASEDHAHRRLRNFIQGVSAPIFAYAENRNRLDMAGTSCLSPYLRFGMLSARQVVVAALDTMSGTSDIRSRRGVGAWLTELIWREFYIYILYHFPFVRKFSFRPSYREIPWQNSHEHFSAWVQGETGYPIVDAAMRQLKQTGWMPNRARMIVASFLTKDLLVDWHLGERHFMQHLVDGDPASNNGGWQWVAGTGTDAAPYFRVFNPVLQGKKFDPQGDYIQRFVPELSRVPDKYIHSPWRMPADVQENAGCVIGKDYPAPIVDHAQARKQALALFRQSINSGR